MNEVESIDNLSVAKMLGALIGKDCKAVAEKVKGAAEKDMCVRGYFVDDEDKLIAAASCDLPFAAFMGAAIAMLPPGGAEDCVDENELSETLEEAYGEVLNVLSRMFNTKGRSHCRYTVMDKGKLSDLGFEPQTVARFNVEIGGYGSGRLTLLAA